MLHSRIRWWASFSIFGLVVVTMALIGCGQDGVPQPSQALVPLEYPSIQDAIDNCAADEIVVGTGIYDGAVIDRPVRLICDGWCLIRSGVPRLQTTTGFLLTESASDTEISGFIFLGPEEGVVSSVQTTGGAANLITIRDNLFINMTQGIANTGEDAHFDGQDYVMPVPGGLGWVVEDNRFVGLQVVGADESMGGGIGVLLMNAHGAHVRNNVFLGDIPEVEWTVGGVIITGSDDTLVQGNVFALDGVGEYRFDVANLGAWQPRGAPSHRFVLCSNDATASSHAFHNVNFIDFDSFDSTIQLNRGVTWVSHRNPPHGDGIEELHDSNGVVTQGQEAITEQKSNLKSGAIRVPAAPRIFQ